MNHVFAVGNYNTPLPGAIYLDTSFIYEVYGNNPGNRYAEECYHFTTRLAENKNIMIVSQLALEELDHVIMKGIYAKYGKQMFPEVRWDVLKKDTNAYMPEVITEIERVYAELFSNHNVLEWPVTMDMEFARMRQDVMKAYSLSPRDASHVVTAYSSVGINSIAAVDIDYQVLPSFNIYTPNDKYVEFGRAPNYLLPMPNKLTD